MFDQELIQQIAEASAKATATMLSEMMQKTTGKESRVKLHGIRGIADYLSCSTATAQGMVKEGKFPVYRVGRKIFVFSDEVEAGIRETKTCL